MKKSFQEQNRDRYHADMKPRRLKENKAKRHADRQNLRDIDLDDLDSLDDFEYTGYGNS